MVEFLLETERLLLRSWHESDIEPFWAIFQDVEGGNFDHPALPEGDRLRRHVLYRIARPR